jgi:50S ribosomal subunit-associated GTPase HflX
MLAVDPVSRVHLNVPQSEGKVLSMLEARARIYAREYRDGSVSLEAEAPESLLRQIRKFVVE